jgi:hypothetical protein
MFQPRVPPRLPLTCILGPRLPTPDASTWMFLRLLLAWTGGQCNFPGGRVGTDGVDIHVPAPCASADDGDMRLPGGLAGARPG